MGNQGKIAKKQSSKIYVYLHISILRFIFERNSVFESIELRISLRTCQSNGDVIFVPQAAKTRSNHSVVTVKKFVRPQHSLDRLKNAGKPRIGISPPAVHVSTPDVKSEREYIEKHLFYGFASL